MDQNTSVDDVNTLKLRVNDLEKKVSKLVALLEMQARTTAQNGPVTSEDYLKIGEEMRVALARYASH